MDSSAEARRRLLCCCVVIGCWGVALFFGATHGLDLLKNCKWSMSSPKGSSSDRAAALARQCLLQKGGQYELSQAALITAKSPATHPVTHPAVRELTARLLAATVSDCDGGVSVNMSATHGSRGHGNVPTCWWRNMHGVFVPDGNALAPHRACGTQRLFEDRDLDVWRDLMSPDNATATLVLWDINTGFGGAGNTWQTEAWRRLGDAINAWLSEPVTASDPLAVAGESNGDLYEVGFTHLQMLLAAGQAGVPQDIERGDMITLPIAWMILLFSCGRSACLVLVTLPVTLLVTFWLLNQVAIGAWFARQDGTAAVDFPSFTPAIFINMIIAISLDYGLFILSRYAEELRRGVSNAVAVTVALSRAGRVVFVSGVTLGLTNAGLTFCSVDVVAAIGWGGTVACFVAVAVHLTLLPALMVVCGPCLACSCCDGDTARDGSRALLSVQTAASVGAGQTVLQRTVQVNQRWVRQGEFCRDHRGGIIIAMVALMVPFSYSVLQYRTSVNGMMLTPRGTAALTAMESITAQGINAGVLNPITILVFNNGSSGATAPLALQPRCHDDDTDLRLLMDGMDLFSIGSLPAQAVTCTHLQQITQGKICTEESLGGVPTLELARSLCPGACSNLCDAAGFGTDARRANLNHTVLAPAVFSLVAQLRARLLHVFPSVRHTILSAARSLLNTDQQTPAAVRVSWKPIQFATLLRSPSQTRWSAMQRRHLSCCKEQECSRAALRTKLAFSASPTTTTR